MSRVSSLKEDRKEKEKPSNLSVTLQKEEKGKENPLNKLANPSKEGVKEKENPSNISTNLIQAVMMRE